MSVGQAVAVFILSLALNVVSSAVLAERVDQMGTWLRLSEGLLGLLTALAADAPEIASAVTAIVGGNHDLGLGVVFGSNIFNLAALLGVGAATAGCVRVGLAGLWIDGAMGLAAALIVAARLFGWIASIWAVVLLAVVLAPYLLISAMKPEYVEHITTQPRLRAMLERILAGSAHEKRKPETPEKPSRTDLLGVVPALVAVVVASVGMVKAAIALGDQWHIAHAIVGTLVLATLTGIPNMFAAVRLALRGRGTAVVSETLNSNNINLIVGALVPVLIFGSSSMNARTELAVIWSVAMTLLALLLSSFRNGLTRVGGLVLIGAYGGFVAVVLIWR